YAGRWNADGKQLITAQEDFSLRLWDWPALDTPRSVLRLHRSEPVHLASDPSGRWLASAGWDNQIYWFDAVDGRLLLTQPGEFVQAAADRPTFFWERNNQLTLADFEPAFVPDAIPMHEHGKSPYRLSFSPDGQWLASSGPDGLRLLNIQSREVEALP